MYINTDIDIFQKALECIILTWYHRRISKYLSSKIVSKMPFIKGVELSHLPKPEGRCFSPSKGK